MNIKIIKEKRGKKAEDLVTLARNKRLTAICMNSTSQMKIHMFA